MVSGIIKNCALKDVKKMSWFLDGCFDIIIFLKRRN